MNIDKRSNPFDFLGKILSLYEGLCPEYENLIAGLTRITYMEYESCDSITEIEVNVPIERDVITMVNTKFDKSKITLLPAILILKIPFNVDEQGGLYQDKFDINIGFSLTDARNLKNEYVLHSVIIYDQNKKTLYCCGTKLGK